MDNLPYGYCLYSEEDTSILLESFKIDDLFTESLKLNVQAQNAYLEKLAIGCNEAKSWTVIERIDKILWFWNQIKDINKKRYLFAIVCEGAIILTLKEILFGKYYNSFDRIQPEQELVDYVITKLKADGFEDYLTDDIVNCYNLHKPTFPSDTKNLKSKLDENRFCYFTQKQCGSDKNQSDNDYQLTQIKMTTGYSKPTPPNYSEWEPTNPNWDYINVVWENDIPIFPHGCVIEQDDDYYSYEIDDEGARIYSNRDENNDERDNTEYAGTTWWFISHSGKSPVIIQRSVKYDGGIIIDVNFNFGKKGKRKL